MFADNPFVKFVGPFTVPPVNTLPPPDDGCHIALPSLSEVNTYPFCWFPSTYLNVPVEPVPPTCNVAVGSSVPSKFKPKPNNVVVDEFPSPFNIVVAEPFNSNHNLPSGFPPFGFITNPSSSAQLQVDSTTKGFLKPRLTTAQKNAIATPAAGLEVYDTDLNRPCFYSGSTWVTL